MGEKIQNLSMLTGDTTLLRNTERSSNSTPWTHYIFQLSTTNSLSRASTYDNYHPVRPALWVYLPGKKLAAS